MKKLYYFVLLLIVFTACEKDSDTPTKQLATPKITWNTTNVTDNILEISITIESTEELPKGSLEFKVDTILIDHFNPSKGAKTQTTNYTFKDESEHNALISYSFSDERPSISKTVKINRLLIETLKKSIKEDWEDL